MAKLFAGLTQTQIAILVLVAGALFIILSDPPMDLCRVQYENFQARLVGHLYPEKNQSAKSVLLEKAYRFCMVSNSPGGCTDYFLEVNRLLFDLRSVNDQCRQEIVSKSEVSNALKTAIEALVKLAWGDSPPQFGVEKLGWLSESDIQLLCRMKFLFKVEKSLATSAEDPWIPNLLKGLPGAEQIGLEERWDRSVLSAPCPNHISI